ETADFLRLAQPLQLLIDGDDVRRLGGVDQAADRRVDQAVLVAVEVAVGEEVADAVPGTVVQQEAAQHAGLGFDRVRRDPQLRDLVVAGKFIVESREDSGHGWCVRGKKGCYAAPSRASKRP